MRTLLAAIVDGTLAGLSVVCWWLAAVVSALSLVGLALAITEPAEFAPGFGAVDIILGWALFAGPLALAALGLRVLSERDEDE